MLWGIGGAQHPQLPTVASTAPRPGATLARRVQRCTRGIANAPISSATYFRPVAHAVLARVAQPPLVLLLDGRAVGRGWGTVRVRGGSGRRARPLAALVVKGKTGHFPARRQCAVVAHIHPELPAAAPVIFLGAGAVDRTDRQATIQGAGWHSVGRTASNVLSGWGAAPMPGSAVGVPPDEIVRVAAGQVTPARAGPVVARAVWDAAEQAPRSLVRNRADAETAVGW